MKKILLLLSAFPFLLNAQNLVPNPGFETQTSCPLVSEITKAPPWNSPSMGTPDLFKTGCPSQNISGRTGSGSSGIFMIINNSNSREYLQARLTSPLQFNKTYCVEFYVKRAPDKFATDRFGVYFSDDSIYLQQTNPLPYTPQVQHPLGNFIRPTNSWTKVSGSYIADGGESFIIIGNFFDNANTVKDSVGLSSSSNVGYYQIDDISVTQCVTGIDEIADSKLKVYPNPANDILFIESEETAESVKVFSMTGRMLMEQPNTATLNEISTANLPNGLYFLTLSTSEGTIVRRFSVAH